MNMNKAPPKKLRAKTGLWCHQEAMWSSSLGHENKAHVLDTGPASADVTCNIDFMLLVQTTSLC